MGHTKELLTGFFDALAAQATGEPSPEAFPGIQPAAKRARTGEAYPVSWSSSGATGGQQDPEISAMAQRVKELQKNDPVKRQEWSDFCDACAGGTKDPSRHTRDTLSQFLEMYDISKWT